MNLPRLAILCDYSEEGWPSMDLCAEMLCCQLSTNQITSLRATRIGPKFRYRASVLPVVGKRRAMLNLDRLLNRFCDYPRYLRSRANTFDFFHICDHSYSQLMHVLPSQRTGVFCHDLDAFRCLLEPSLEPRPRWFRWMARRILDGLQKAAIVFHQSHMTRQQLEKFGLIDPNRLVYAPLGIAPEFKPGGDDEESEETELACLKNRPFLLHVGSCIPRKRIDVLLDVFARLRMRHRDLLLVQVGGTWTQEQRDQIDRLHIAPSMHQLRGLNRETIAALYRHALVVLQPSEAEGFGLPVLEGLACGAVVVATDLPVLREVGGEAAVYCPLGDVEAWTVTVNGLLQDPGCAPARPLRLAHAQQFTWAAHARTIVNAYQRLPRE